MAVVPFQQARRGLLADGGFTQLCLIAHRTRLASGAGSVQIDRTNSPPEAMTSKPQPPRARRRAADPDAPPRRRMRGFEPAAALVAPDLRRAAEKRGFAVARLLTDGAHAPLVQMQLPRLRERVNAVYGFNAISRIVVTQTAAQGFAEGQAQFRPAPPQQSPVPAPEVVARAEEVAARFEDPKLADSMRRLALARAARDTRKRPPFSQD